MTANHAVAETRRLTGTDAGGTSSLDVALAPMDKSAVSFEFALAVKRDALGPHIADRWGWNEVLQRNQQAESWSTLSFFRIDKGGTAVGAVSLEKAPGYVNLVGFYIRPAFHRKGIGTEVLRRLIAEADVDHLPVRLRCLKWNPALSLYMRHGFVVTGETDTHYEMQRRVREAG